MSFYVLPTLLNYISIGWNLTLEYAISACVLSRSFGSYLVLFIESFGVDVWSLS